MTGLPASRLKIRTPRHIIIQHNKGQFTAASMNGDDEMSSMTIPPKAIRKLAEHVYKDMSEEEKKYLARHRPDDSSLFHMSLGMYIRNHYGLWGSNDLWAKISREYIRGPVIFDPDSVSGLVIRQVIMFSRAEFLRHIPRYLVMTTELAGTFAGDYDAVHEAKKGQRVILEREPFNKHDENAVKVLDRHGLKLGYLPRAVAEKVARDLDERFAVRDPVILNRTEIAGTVGLTVRFRIDMRKRESDQLQQVECPRCRSRKIQTPMPESRKWQCRACGAAWEPR
jgi:hypothetical protein